MADDVENDDQWLYGDAPEIPALENGNQEQGSLTPPAQPEETTEAPQEEEITTNEEKRADPAKESNDPAPPGTEDTEKQNGDASDKDDSDEDDDSDDDVNVVIGDIKTTPAYTSLNIKRGGLLTSTATDKSKQLQQPGKFNVDEFEQMGIINGVQAAEYNLDSLEDKPWRKPGADITDYFNYGFNEETWKAYCERQKRLRVNESGVGLVPLNSIGLPRGPIPIMNDNSKYSGTFLGIRKAGPPPGRRMTGAIDVIGGPVAPGTKGDAPKENVIQVMTADRREYSRKPPGFPDLTMPPPSFEEFRPEFGFNPEPEPFYGGYEPTQDSQWGTHATNPNWAPHEIKSLTPGPPMVPAPVPAVVPTMVPPVVPPLSSKEGSSPPPPRRAERAESRERGDRESSRARSEKPRDRDRERSHRRERSRSRSRRHKSRSRSPTAHRSHRKSKKSRRHDDSD